METPDTSTYMIAGFVVSFLTLGLYVLSLHIRNRNLKQDIETLENLGERSTKR